jgi:hypothetical protein
MLVVFYKIMLNILDKQQLYQQFVDDKNKSHENQHVIELVIINVDELMDQVKRQTKQTKQNETNINKRTININIVKAYLFSCIFSNKKQYYLPINIVIMQFVNSLVFSYKFLLLNVMLVVKIKNQSKLKHMNQQVYSNKKKERYAIIYICFIYIIIKKNSTDLTI